MFIKIINNINLPGMRVIKTAIAIFLCLVTMSFVDENYSSYSALVAIVCMQKDWNNSLQASKERVIGTILGAIFAIITNYVIMEFNFVNYPVISYGIIAVIMIILMMVTIAINGNEITAITCIIYLSISTVTDINEDIAYFALRRILDTFIGISIALLVNISINDAIIKKIKKFFSIKS